MNGLFDLDEKLAIGVKRCRFCMEVKPLTEFYPRKDKKIGLRSECKACSKAKVMEYHWKNRDARLASSRRWWQANKEYALKKKQKHYYENRERERILHLTRLNAKPKRAWARHTLSSHKTKFNMEISLNELHEYIAGIEKCAICGCQLKWGFEGERRLRSNSPTLDRMGNESAITIGDIQILCWLCNTTKSKRTMPEFIEYCRMVAEKFGGDEYGTKAV